MRGAPQVGFSATMRKINSRTSLDNLFLPTCFLTFEIMLQYMRNPVRYQRTTVSGLTTMRELLPRRPKVASEHPEQFVDGSESGLRMLALQDSQLLPELQVLKEQPSAVTKAAGQQSYTQPREVKHGP